VGRVKRVLVVGRITEPHKESHASVDRILEVRADDGNGMILRGRYLVTGSKHFMNDPRLITSWHMRGMLHEIADIRGEEFK
jgi:hypothetical protein